MAESNGPTIIRSLWALSGVSLAFMSLRFYCKILHAHQLAVDDVILLASWILSCAYAATIHVSVIHGMGKHLVDISPDDMIKVNEFFYVGQFFLFIAIPVAKTSFAITLIRISTQEWQRWFLWFVIVTMNVAMWLCGVLLFAQCQPVEYNWDKTIVGTCWESYVQDNYAIFAAIYSVIVDFTIALFPYLLIRKLQMSFKEKFGVVFAMSLGFLAGITVAVKIRYLPGIGKFKDPTHSLSDILIWSHAETSATIIAASIPFFRVLIKHATSRGRPYRYGEGYRLDSYMQGHRRESGASGIEADEIISPRNDVSLEDMLRAPPPGVIIKESRVNVEFTGKK
ncbi:hypothetical protein BS50DRAFT_319876 [Corynespora cassiicola Philippines]|uniref:Rhodopsin domain-containing protein n=1 Tax=Corynespora cassiicola Philippines TaxID=1448308 RepID=A0A2T2NTG1_CORCC|nr:hypothetical protein BS50DRAFT_319876 [Corynespora cassiicola Philippines]